MTLAQDLVDWIPYHPGRGVVLITKEEPHKECGYQEGNELGLTEITEEGLHARVVVVVSRGDEQAWYDSAEWGMTNEWQEGPPFEPAKVTVVTMYRGHDAETFVGVVEGKLTDEQKDAWRKTHKCDQYGPKEPDDENNMGFRVVHTLHRSQTGDLKNIFEQA